MSTKHIPKPRKKLTKDGWILIGMECLREDGAENLIIDALCTKAGKTRGSFYFHFNTLDEFLEILIQNWFEQYTLSFTEKSIPHCSRLDLFYQLSSRLDLKLEAQIQRLACWNQSAAKILTLANEKRTTWLSKLYQKTGHYSKAHAQSLSNIEYAAFIGFLMMDRNLSASQTQATYQDFLTLTNR